jgi:hypothetical protein
MTKQTNPNVLASYRVIDALDISDMAKIAFRNIICTRGKRAGYVKASSPNSSTLEAAAWQGVAASCNPYKMSIFAQIMFNEMQRETYKQITAALDALPPVARKSLFDHDRATLEALGAW